jgi:hypothetical protein
MKTKIQTQKQMVSDYKQWIIENPKNSDTTFNQFCKDVESGMIILPPLLEEYEVMFEGDCPFVSVVFPVIHNKPLFQSLLYLVFRQGVANRRKDFGLGHRPSIPSDDFTNFFLGSRFQRNWTP